MADTIEKRASELEYVLAHLPEDLDARFAGVDTKLASIREVQALHTTRFTTVERKIDDLTAQATRFTTIERKIDDLTAQVAEVLRQLPQRPPETA